MTRLQAAIAAISGLLTCAAHAATYYVDALSGNDLWSGKLTAANVSSTDGPWKSIAKVNQTALAGGDSILFRCGGVWREQLAVNGSGSPGKPITYSRYGTCVGNAGAVISGADVVSNWQALPVAGQIYVAPVSYPVQQLFVDGKRMRLAQWPNKSVAGGKTRNFSPARDVVLVNDSNQCPAPQDPCRSVSLKDPALPARPAADLVGAGIHLRSSQFAFEDRKVAAFDPPTRKITLDTPTEFSFTNGSGYYLDNKLWMLDEPGEWFYDQSARKLYLWLPLGDAPVNHLIEASRAGRYGIVAAGRANILIKALNVRQAEVGIDVIGSSAVQLSGVQFSDSAAHAVLATWSSALTLDGVTIARSGLMGVSAEASTDLAVLNSQITETGTVASPHAYLYGALYCYQCKNSRIVNNRINNSAYIGIRHGTDSLVSGNYVTNSCLLLNDCGAIYTDGRDLRPNRSRVTNNIITDVTGNADGLPNGDGYPVNAIYLDDYANNVEVTGNTVMNTDYGVFIHNGFDNNVANNTIYGTRTGALFFHEDGAQPSIARNRIASNLLFPNADARSVDQLTRFDATAAFAAFDLNRHANPMRKIVRERLNVSGAFVEKNYTLPEWQQVMAQDLTARTSGLFGIAPYRILASVAGNLIANGAFDLGASSWGPNGASAAANWVQTCVTGACIEFATGAEPRAELISNDFALQQGKSYRVSFDLRARREGASVEVNVRKDGPWSYAGLGLMQQVTAGVAWQSYSFLFKATATSPLAGESGARLDFAAGPGELIYLDNIRVQEVTVEYANANANTSSMLVFNSATTARSINCPLTGVNAARCGEYVDFSDGTKIVWPFTLPAKGSKIVVWANSPLRDSDFDGVADIADACPNTPIGMPVNEQGCAFQQTHP